MAQNVHVLQRLTGIQEQLIAGFRASSSMSSAAKGFERQQFIDNFLAQVLPNTFRFGTGEATDKDGKVASSV